MKKVKFEIKREHFGEWKFESEKHGFNTIVISGPCPSSTKPEQRVGRLVQVRKKSGGFGSDTILIRMMNGRLQSWENQSFCSIAPEYANYYESLFKDVELDTPDIEYSICDRFKATGFVVEGMDCTDGKEYSFDMEITENEKGKTIQFSETKVN